MRKSIERSVEASGGFATIAFLAVRFYGIKVTDPLSWLIIVVAAVGSFVFFYRRLRLGERQWENLARQVINGALTHEQAVEHAKTHWRAKADIASKLLAELAVELDNVTPAGQIRKALIKQVRKLGILILITLLGGIAVATVLMPVELINADKFVAGMFLGVLLGLMAFGIVAATYSHFLRSNLMEIAGKVRAEYDKRKKAKEGSE